MEDKKRLYWNSCSFLDDNGIINAHSPLYSIFNGDEGEDDRKSYKASVGGSSNESIFRRTLIDCSKNKFDFAIIAWSHPERYFIVDLDCPMEIELLRNDADRQFFPTKWNEQMYGYQHQIPHHLNKHSNVSADVLKFEPKGTDDTIFYTISLHNFFKQKGIPHLFLNMGKLDSDILWARESWLQGIDPKNYLSLNPNDTILQKMQFSFVEYFLGLDNNPFIKDKEINELRNANKLDISIEHKIYTSDDAGHLSRIGYDVLSKVIYNHIINNLI